MKSLLIALSCVIMVGCASINPPTIEEVSAGCSGRIKSVSTADTMRWGFLSFSSSNSRKADCEAKQD